MTTGETPLTDELLKEFGFELNSADNSFKKQCTENLSMTIDKVIGGYRIRHFQKDVIFQSLPQLQYVYLVLTGTQLIKPSSGKYAFLFNDAAYFDCLVAEITPAVIKDMISDANQRSLPQ